MNPAAVPEVLIATQGLCAKSAWGKAEFLPDEQVTSVGE